MKKALLGSIVTALLWGWSAAWADTAPENTVDAKQETQATAPEKKTNKNTAEESEPECD